MKGYPIFLIGLEGKHSVVVGGGREAERKIEGLVECDAAVTVIAPRVTDRIRTLADEGKLTWIDREFLDSDLRGVFLVIASEQDSETNNRIWTVAQREGTLANVMDDVDHCNFIAGSVVRQGDLTIAISTNGCAPALAVRLKQRLQRELGSEYGAFLEMMSELRESLARRYPDFEQRRAVWYELVDSEIIDRLREGSHDLARVRIEQLIALPESTSQQ